MRSKHVKCTSEKAAYCTSSMYIKMVCCFSCDSVYQCKEVFPDDFLLKMLILHWWLWLTSVASLVRSEAGRKEILGVSS